MLEKRHVDEERGLFRREMLDYQRNRRIFGEALDTRPLSFALCLGPVIGLLMLTFALSRVEYAPRLRAQVSPAGPGAASLLIPLEGGPVDVLRAVRAGAQIEIEIEGIAARLRVERVATRSCGAFSRCVELEGPWMSGPAPVALRAATTTTVGLPARALLSLWRKG